MKKPIPNLLRPTPIWLLPINWNISEMEGRQAYLERRPVDDHPFGDCSAAKDFERGWRAEELKHREEKYGRPKIG